MQKMMHKMMQTMMQMVQKANAKVMRHQWGEPQSWWCPSLTIDGWGVLTWTIFAREDLLKSSEAKCKCSAMICHCYEHLEQEVATDY